MKRRELTMLVVGLVVGLVIGMLAVGSSDSFRESLFGTASNDTSESTAAKNQDVVYYLADLSSAHEWLAEQYPDSDQTVGDAVDVIAKLSTSTDFRKDFRDAKDQIETLLPQMYGALVQVENIDEPKIVPNNKTSACLGLSDDPYNVDGPVMYVYMTIPTSQAKTLDIPKAWEKLNSDKSNDLYWQLLACYPELETQNPS